MTDLPWDSLAFERESAWGTCLRSFLRAVHERSGSTSTLTNYRQNLIKFFSSPAKMPHLYSREDVETFIHSNCTSPGKTGLLPAPSTINGRLSALRSFYAYAATYTVMNEHGTLEPVLSTLAPTTGRRALHVPLAYRALSIDELKQLFTAIPTDTDVGLKYRALFLTYVYTARRRAEVLRLRYGDIEKTTIVESDGTRRIGYAYHFSGKGHARERDVAELPMPAAEAIVAYLEHSGRQATIQANDYIFTADHPPSHRPDKPISPQTALKSLKRYARIAGLDPTRISIHSFRHFSAQERYIAGSDIRSIQQILGHASLATTSRYLHQTVPIADSGAALLTQRIGNV